MSPFWGFEIWNWIVQNRNVDKDDLIFQIRVSFIETRNENIVKPWTFLQYTCLNFFTWQAYSLVCQLLRALFFLQVVVTPDKWIRPLLKTGRFTTSSYLETCIGVRLKIENHDSNKRILNRDVEIFEFIVSNEHIKWNKNFSSTKKRIASKIQYCSSPAGRCLLETINILW